MEKEDYFKIIQIFNDAYDKAESASIMLLGIEMQKDYQYKNPSALKRLKEIIGMDREFNHTALEIVSIIDPKGAIVNQANINTNLIENAFHQELRDTDSPIHKLIMEGDFPVKLKVKIDKLRHLASEANDLIGEI